MSVTELISFDELQQAAIFGHALVKPELWDQFDELEITDLWWIKTRHQVLWRAAQEYRKQHNRPPSGPELVAFIRNGETPSEAAACQKALADCTRATEKFGFDVLRTKLVEWKKSAIIVESAKTVAAKYSAGDLDGATAAWTDGIVEVQRLDVVGGQTDSMRAAPDRLEEEAREREENSKKRLKFGISYLDDLLKGIFPDDFVIIGARSGVGKTELAKIIASDIADATRQNKVVAAFFLEAQTAEIERRLKFGMLMDRWRASVGHGSSDVHVEFPEWLAGESEQALHRYEKEVDEEFHARYQGLKTYYRKHGDFTLKTMDREVLKVAETADVVILDHIHYVDTPGENENAEMTELAHRLNDIAGAYRIPVVAVSHLKKGAGKTIVPEMDDFHGSSNISKICKNAVMLAQCNGFGCEEYPTQQATFFNIVKSRIAGPRARKVGVSWYNQETGRYEEKYALGTVNMAGSKWTPVDASHYPFWANDSRTIRNITEVTA